MDLRLIKRTLPASLFQSDAEFLQAAHKDEAAELARKHAVDAVNTLIHLMANSACEKIRVKCALEIINRAYGAPKQVIEDNRNGSIIEVLASISESGGGGDNRTLEGVSRAICAGSLEGEGD